MRIKLITLYKLFEFMVQTAWLLEQQCNVTIKKKLESEFNILIFLIIIIFYLISMNKIEMLKKIQYI